MRQLNVLTMLLAGGIGERLFPLTSNRCKPAVPFGGNFRIIDFTLMNCVLSDLRRIHVLSQYHSQSIDRHKMSRWSFLSRELGEFIEMVPPKLRAATTHYRGTADAVYRNLDILDQYRPDLVLVLSGDHVYRADYRRFIDAHVKRDADATVLTGHIDPSEASSFGVINVNEEGQVLKFIEKPANPHPYAVDGRCLINLGVYCFETEFLVSQLVADAKQRTPHDFGRNILPSSLGSGRVLSCPFDVVCPDGNPYWRDVGSIDSYFQANMDLLRTPAGFDLMDPRWAPDSHLKEWVPARCTVRATIGGQAVAGRNLIGSGVETEDAQIVNSVLSPGARVGRDAELEECVLFPGSRVGAGAKLRRVIVEEGVEIPAGARIGFGSDSHRFLTSPGGVVVVAGTRSFDEVVPDFDSISVTQEDEAPAEKITQAVDRRAATALATP